jgi:uncharacterized membrane protein
MNIFATLLLFIAFIFIAITLTRSLIKFQNTIRGNNYNKQVIRQEKKIYFKKFIIKIILFMLLFLLLGILNSYIN